MVDDERKANGGDVCRSIYLRHLVYDKYLSDNVNLVSSMSRPQLTQPAADALPPTARAIALLLASTPAVQDAQPGVLHQLLEFAHRYTVQVLSDAQVYADHAGRSGTSKIEMDDIVLAVQARVGWEFGGRIPKEVRCVRNAMRDSPVLIFTALVRPLASVTDKCNTSPGRTGSFWRSFTAGIRDPLFCQLRIGTKQSSSPCQTLW